MPLAIPCMDPEIWTVTPEDFYEHFRAVILAEDQWLGPRFSRRLFAAEFAANRGVRGGESSSMAPSNFAQDRHRLSSSQPNVEDLVRLVYRPLSVAPECPKSTEQSSLSM